MSGHQFRYRVGSRDRLVRGLLTMAAAAWLPSAALAQTAPSARNANRWNGFEHQPTRAATAARERQAGVALSTDQKRQEDQALRGIGTALLQHAGSGLDDR